MVGKICNKKFELTNYIKSNVEWFTSIPPSTRARGRSASLHLTDWHISQGRSDSQLQEEWSEKESSIGIMTSTQQYWTDYAIKNLPKNNNLSHVGMSLKLCWCMLSSYLYSAGSFQGWTVVVRGYKDEPVLKVSSGRRWLFTHIPLKCIKHWSVQLCKKMI